MWMKHDIKSKNKTQSSFSSQSQPKWLGLAELIPHVSRKGTQTSLLAAAAANRLCTFIRCLGCTKQAQTFHQESWLIWHCPQQTGNLRLSVQLTDAQKSSLVALEREHRLPPPSKNSTQEARANSFCIFQKKGCVCVQAHTHVCTTFLEEWLPRTGVNSDKVEMLFHQMVGIPRTAFFACTNKTDRNLCPHEADFSRGM